MNRSSLAPLCRLSAAGLIFVLLGGCGLLPSTSASPPSFYTLDNVGSAPAARRETPAAERAAAPTLIVSPPHAASGFDSQRIIYVRDAHRLEYYAHSEWVDPPARMLAPLIVATLENSGTFRAVVLTPSAAAGELRLDSEIIRLQHDLGSQPSRVRFTLRAYIVDNTTRQVLAWREFDESTPVASETPYGSVVAANRAVHAVLENLASFSAGAARNAAVTK